MGGKKVTIKDIALAANVSPATVSNAINNKMGVSKQTQEKIKRVALELGYTRKVNRTRRLPIQIVIYKRSGIVVSDTPFFTQLIEGMQQQSRAANLDMVISHVSKEGDYHTQIAEIKQDDVSGYIILATEMLHDDYALFENIDKPIVFLDSLFPYKDKDFVLINNGQGAYLATQHLIDYGHRSIGYLHSSVYINNFHYRKQGFLGALAENNITADRDSWFEVEPTLNGAYRDTHRLLSKGIKELPTAFFADNDIIAFGAMSAFKEFGIKIPEQVSVVAFDDMPYCEISDPKLTTIRVNKKELGAITVKRLLEKINNTDAVSQKIEMNVELVKRNSVLMIKQPVKAVSRAE